MRRVDDLLELKRRAFSGSPWHSLKAALEGISDDVFFRAPTAHGGFPWMNGSIADIVFHVTGDKLVQVSAAFEDGVTNWESLDKSLSKTDRELMMNELEHAERVLDEVICAQTDESLTTKVPTWGGKRMSCRDFFLMLIEHDYYHAGQIRYVRNVFES